MDKTVFRYIEHVIKEYRDIEQLLLEEEHEEVYCSDTKEENSGRYKTRVGKPTENKAIRLLTSKTRRRMLENQRAVYRVFQELPKEKQIFMELDYWTRPKNKTIEGLAQQLHIGTTMLYAW